MTYTQKQVDRGIKLVAGLTKNKRDLGLLALEIIPRDTVRQGIDWQTSPLRTEMEEFALAIGSNFSQLTEYRRTVLAFVDSRNQLRWRDDLSYAVHRVISASDDPIKMLHSRKTWSIVSAQEKLGRKTDMDLRGRGLGGISPGQLGDSGPIIDSEEAVQQALKADPYMAKRVIRKAVIEDDVLARAIVEDQGTRVALGKATMDRSRDMVDRQKLTQSPAQTRRDEQAAWLDVMRQDAVVEMGQFLRAVEGHGALTDEQRLEVVEVAERWQTALDFLNAFINGGSKPLSDQLAEFLEGQ